MLGALAGIGALGGDALSAGMNIKVAREQMDFQERMSNTAHQRQMKDMYKAGLNPILSASYGGASQPTGALAKMPDFGGGIRQSSTIGPQREQIRQQTKLSKEQTRAARANATIAEASVPGAVLREKLLSAGYGEAGAAFDSLMVEYDKLKKRFNSGERGFAGKRRKPEPPTKWKHPLSHYKGKKPEGSWQRQNKGSTGGW